jgi:DNA-binding NtrC family response regulator
VSEASVSRVLILDDCRTQVSVLCNFAKLFGYEPCGVNLHETALEVATEFQPDFFLTGYVNYGDEYGTETAEDVARIVPTCRIAIFSGSVSAEPAVEEYRRRGYDFEFFWKPFHPDTFREWLQSHGAHAGKGMKDVFDREPINPVEAPPSQRSRWFWRRRVEEAHHISPREWIRR